MTCLGCGGVVCQVCEDKSNALTRLSHWPLEVSVSRAALLEVEALVRAGLQDNVGYADNTYAELQNIANIIRAHLQHEPAPTVLQHMLAPCPEYPSGRTAYLPVEAHAVAPVSTDEDWLS